MSGGSVFGIYIGAVLAIGVILVALGVSLVMYQRRFLALHRDYAKKLILAHEEERAYVAREVHDDALQRVALLQHDVEQWAASDNGAASDKEQARSKALRGELEDLGVMLRRVAHRLHPAIIEQGGLIPALAQLAEDNERMSGLSVDTRLPPFSPDRLIDRERSLILFRIAQEALRNVAKHANATRAEVAVEVANKQLILSVSDNGRGFDPGGAHGARGLGLISMGERARLADGNFSLFSKPGGGTTIRVTVPLRD
jgi:two-component system sensor histidine kinase UhpB